METDEDDSDEDEVLENITGMQLSNPNYFFSRMEKRDPTLFLKKKQGKFNAYSRMCPSNVRRQPIILTNKEKNKIDKEHPGSYKHAIKYGSNPNKQYWYICPRYWCLTKNTSITKEEIEQGECGGKDAIIPFGSRKVPPGKQIFEFYAKSEHENTDGSYIDHYPGFIPGSKHPDGHCMPCCFKAWDAPEQIRRRKECNIEQNKEITPTLRRIKSNEPENYIKGSEKFPLDQNRWGYLPISIQLFLNFDNTKCHISKTNTNIKAFKPCLLRHGVESSNKQSFIACLADLYVDYIEDQDIIPTIKEMKQFIIKALDLDNFASYNNGNLIQEFYDTSITDIDIDKYSNTKLFDSIDTTNEKELDFLERNINAFEQFIKYLNDDQIEISYKYLWDIVTEPNPKLFKLGLNLIILEIVDNDATDNVEIICPTNHYSNNFYNARLSTLLLLKIGDFYEPIYLYTDIETKIKVEKTFNVYSKLPPTLKKSIDSIKNDLNKYCSPIKSIPKVYKFKESILVNELIKILQSSRFTINIKHCVLNYNSKIIGLFVSLDGYSGMIPCYPSGFNFNNKYKFIDDEDNWRSYTDTISFLKYVKDKLNIPCLPKLKVIEDELVIGILTETNQFIQISPPSEIIDDSLPEVRDYNYVLGDSKILTTKTEVDTERINIIRTIKLEQNFYNTFRNIIRMLINKYENITFRKQLIDIINSEEIDYYKKLELIIKQLHELVDTHVDFINYKPDILNKIISISNCNLDKECNKLYCLKENKKNGDICKLLIPKKNLRTGKDNSIQYYGQVADELIRYTRIRKFILEPNNFLSFNEVTYKVNDDESILLQSILLSGYLNDLTKTVKNKYINSNTFDESLPLISESYSEIIEKKNNKILNCMEPPISIKGELKKRFPENFNEQIIQNTPHCTLEFINYIINEYTNSSINNNKIKEILSKEYTKLFSVEKYTDYIYNILSDQGKDIKIKMIRSNDLSFETYLFSDDFFITKLDIWILALHFKLPLILISSTKLQENNLKLMKVIENTDNKYIFIKVPGGMIKNGIPNYSVITDNNKNIIIDNNIHNINELVKEINSVPNIILNDYILSFKPKKYKRAKKLKLIETSPKQANPQVKKKQGKLKLVDNQ